MPRPLATLSLLLILVLSGPLIAQGAGDAQAGANGNEARVAPLLRALAIEDLLGIMREEGLSYATELEADMFPGRGGSRWPAMVARIYDSDRMVATMAAEMDATLEDHHLGPLLDFFGSELGERVVALEVSARRAFLEPSVERTSIEAVEEMRAENAPRLGLLETFATVNDLIEMNVVGALNSNFAFYVGLDAGGAFDSGLSEADMLRDVWRQEDEIRAETAEWVFAYLAMAYGPLSDAELKDYIALSESPAGQALNASLFAAFDVLFQQVSRDLGMAAAQFMAGEDI